MDFNSLLALFRITLLEAIFQLLQERGIPRWIASELKPGRSGIVIDRKETHAELRSR